LKSDLPLGARTDNEASIYFDINAPILTNPIDLPNALTPNNDNLNDEFHILNQSYLARKNISVEKIVIMNRWGQTIYTGQGLGFNWKPNQESPNDVYTYFIVYRAFSGNTYTQRGEIVLIH
jgi:gliding motility-associated-like protein